MRKSYLFGVVGAALMCGMIGGASALPIPLSSRATPLNSYERSYRIPSADLHTFTLTPSGSRVYVGRSGVKTHPSSYRKRGMPASARRRGKVSHKTKAKR